MMINHPPTGANLKFGRFNILPKFPILAGFAFLANESWAVKSYVEALETDLQELYAENEELRKSLYHYERELAG